MAIAFGSSTRLASFSAANTLSGSSPSVSGSNTLAVCCVMLGSGPSVSSLTWGGVAMTEATGANTQVAISNDRLQIFYLANPPAGVSTVSLTASANWNGAFVGCLYYTGVNQGSPLDLAGRDNTISNTFSGTATTSNDNEYVIDNIAQRGAGTLSATGAGQTRQQVGSNGGSSTAWACSDKPVASAGTTTMSWSSTISERIAWGWISIKPARVSMPPRPPGFFTPRFYSSRRTV